MRLVAAVLGVTGSILLARLGGPELKGVASAFAAANALAFAAVNLDLAQQVLRTGREARTLSDSAGLLLRTWPYYLLLIGTTGLALWRVGFVDAAWLSLGTLCFLLPTQLGVVANGIVGPMTTAIGALLQQAAMIGFTLGAHITIGLDETSVKALVCLAYLTPLPYFAVATRRKSGSLPRAKRLTLHLFGDMIRQGFRWQPSRILQLALLRVDTLAVFAVLGSSPAGVYSVGLSTASLASLLPAQFAANTTFTATQGQASGFRSNLAGALASATVGAILMAAVGWLLIPIAYGAQFEDAYLVQLLASPGIIAYAGLQVITNQERIRGGASTVAVPAAIGVVTMVCAMVPLLPTLGAPGAALASSAGAATAMFASYLLLRRRARATR